jgi:hypothetical protein
MLQQGEVFRLNSGTGETSCWAYRYRVGGHGSRRVQRGGFTSERDASEALDGRWSGCGVSEAAAAR